MVHPECEKDAINIAQATLIVDMTSTIIGHKGIPCALEAFSRWYADNMEDNPSDLRLREGLVYFYLVGVEMQRSGKAELHVHR